MTLIVGIKCQDGIVLGADGAATFGALGLQTIRQPMKKLEIMSDCVVVGVSGPGGLHQRFTDEVRQLWEAGVFARTDPGEPGHSSATAMVKISEVLRKHILVELQAAMTASGLVGHAIAQQSAISQTVVVLPIRGEHCLFQFDQQGAPEECTEQLPFVSIGSARGIADPFLAFIRRIFWKEGPLNINAGIFAALWTLHHAIKANPGEILEPKQLVVMEKEGDNWRARELKDEEQQEHFQAIERVEEYLSKYPPTAEAPPPPRP